MEKVINKKINVALFGFGRIGRNIFRLALNDTGINVVAISEKAHIEILQLISYQVQSQEKLIGVVLKQT